MHCINLRNGSPSGSKPKLDDDLYLGNVYNGKVLIVGKKNVARLSLSNGEQLWTLETGVPSGQGIGSDNIYYLPLKEAGRARIAANRRHRHGPRQDRLAQQVSARAR